MEEPSAGSGPDGRHRGAEASGPGSTTDPRRPRLDLRRPHLVGGPDRGVLLVEGDARRAVAPEVGAVLEATLGAPAVTSGVTLDPPDEQPPVALATTMEGRGLASLAPTGSRIALAGATDTVRGTTGRVVEAITVDATTRGVGAEPDNGRGALDRLAIARARGATHFLLPVSSAWWLDRYPPLADHLARRAQLVAASPAGAMWQLRAPPPPGDSKVFGIGLNKTATSSLHLALTQFGYRSLHWGDRASYHAVLAAQRDGERLMRYVGEQYDAFSDIATLSVRFDLADLQYPGSRFVLTVRDVDQWVDSRRRHVERNKRNQAAGRYQGSNFRVDEEQWRAQWQEHLDRVHEWFDGRDDVLVMDICAGDGWELLAPFLGRPVPRSEFPRTNVDRKPAVPTPGPVASPRGVRARIERSLAVGWHTVQRHLPPRLAEQIRKPSTQVLRRLRVISPSVARRVGGTETPSS